GSLGRRATAGDGRAARRYGGRMTDPAASDDAPLPTDTVPDDLAAALVAVELSEDFAALAPPRQRELVASVLGARRPETRAKRVQAAVDAARALAARR